MSRFGGVRPRRLWAALPAALLATRAPTALAADPSAQPSAPAGGGFPGADLVNAFAEFVKAAATNPLSLIAAVLIVVGVLANISARARALLLFVGLGIVILVVGTNYLSVVRSNENAFDRARSMYEGRLQDCQFAMGTLKDLVDGKLRHIDTPAAAQIIAEQMQQVMARTQCLAPLPSGLPTPDASIPPAPTPSEGAGSASPAPGQS
jgi:hypothetical protein